MCWGLLAMDIMGDEVVFSDGVESRVSAVQVKGLETDVPAAGLGVCDSTWLALYVCSEDLAWLRPLCEERWSGNRTRESNDARRDNGEAKRIPVLRR